MRPGSTLTLSAIATILMFASALLLTEHDDSLFVHSVYFWLKEEVTDEERASFVEILKELEQIESVQALEVAVSADTPREVVDNSYDIALFVYFNDRIGHDKYQSDPIHTDAVSRFEDWIEEIRIYDAITLD